LPNPADHPISTANNGCNRYPGRHQWARRIVAVAEIGVACERGGTDEERDCGREQYFHTGHTSSCARCTPTICGKIYQATDRVTVNDTKTRCRTIVALPHRAPARAVVATRPPTLTELAGFAPCNKGSASTGPVDRSGRNALGAATKGGFESEVSSPPGGPKSSWLRALPRPTGRIRTSATPFGASYGSGGRGAWSRPRSR
jgi:hypothetical protein